MTIASELTKLQTNLTNAYNAIEAKGGSLPANLNMDNLSTAVSNIPSGGSNTKYGADINTFLGNIDSNGVLQLPTVQSNLVFTGVEDITAYGLAYKFYKSGVKSVSFPDLTIISGSYACQSMLYECTTLTSASFPALTTISGNSGCQSMLYRCTALTSVSFPNLTTISGSQGCYSMLSRCTSLTSASFPALITISGNSACNSLFSACTALTDAYFPALTTSSFGSYTNQFNNLVQGTGKTTTHTLHFPSNLESTISGLSGYPLFGGTSGYVILAFDLPATEYALTFNLTGNATSGLGSLTVNGTTYTYSNFTNNSLTLMFIPGTSITWSAIPSAGTTLSPSSGSLTLNSDSTVTIDTAVSYSGGSNN